MIAGAGQKQGGRQMTSGYESSAKVLLIIALATGAALVVLSELYPNEEEGNVSGQELVAGQGRVTNVPARPPPHGYPESVCGGNMIWYSSMLTAMMSAFPSRENRLTLVSADGAYIRVSVLTMTKRCLPLLTLCVSGFMTAVSSSSRNRSIRAARRKALRRVRCRTRTAEVSRGGAAFRRGL
jgi:hypothetical protein